MQVCSFYYGPDLYTVPLRIHLPLLPSWLMLFSLLWESERLSLLSSEPSSDSSFATSEMSFCRTKNEGYSIAYTENPRHIFNTIKYNSHWSPVRDYFFSPHSADHYFRSCILCVTARKCVVHSTHNINITAIHARATLILCLLHSHSESTLLKQKYVYCMLVLTIQSIA